MSDTTPDALLTGLRALFAIARMFAERGWCQGAEARDANGVPCEPADERARSWSVRGALLAASSTATAETHVYSYQDTYQGAGGLTRLRATGTQRVPPAPCFTSDDYRDACYELAYVLLEQHGLVTTIDPWNDAPGRTVAEVLAAFDTAIETVPNG